MVNFVKRKWKFILPISIVIVILLLINPSFSTATPTVTIPDRMAGETAYDTSLEIVKTYAQGQKLQSVILASGKTFPDALSASTLSKKLNAPILLVGMTANDDGTKKVLQYLGPNLASDATVYIVGGTGIIGSDIEQAVRMIPSGPSGTKVVRLSGYTLYDTNAQIVNEIAARPGTPVIVASGERFPDALSASSIAGNNGWPILLVGKDTLTEDVKNYIVQNHPTNIYVVGGPAIIPDSIVNTINSIATASLVQRVYGYTLYDTSGEVAKDFASSPTDIYLANGNYFPDALSGSSLASLDGSPILLVDHLTRGIVPDGIVSYLQTLKEKGIQPKIHVLGGTFVVPDQVVQNVKNILAGNPQVQTPPKDPNNPLPDWTPPTITGTAGSDKTVNINKIVNELGFENQSYGNGHAAVFRLNNNPLFPAIRINDFGGETQGLDEEITISYWTYDPQFPNSYEIPFLTSEILRFYLPSGYTQIMNIIKTSDNNFTTTLWLDGREVDISGGGAFIKIGKPGERIIEPN